ncbi:MAG: hypothetical protein ACR2RL_24120 [Gammaproteobacteria bacterium]
MVVRYPLSALVPDALRAGAGLTFAISPFLFMDLLPAARIVLAVLAMLFAMFGVQVWRRFRARFEFDDESLRVLPGGPQIRWADADRLSLRWFSLRREALGRGFASLGRLRRSTGVPDPEPQVNCSPDRGSPDWRRQGWLELDLRAGANVIRIDSRLQCFEDIVELAAAGSSSRLTTDPATQANLALLANGPSAAADTQDLLAS